MAYWSLALHGTPKEVFTSKKKIIIIVTTGMGLLTLTSIHHTPLPNSLTVVHQSDAMITCSFSCGNKIAENLIFGSKPSVVQLQNFKKIFLIKFYNKIALSQISKTVIKINETYKWISFLINSSLAQQLDLECQVKFLHFYICFSCIIN